MRRSPDLPLTLPPSYLLRDQEREDLDEGAKEKGEVGEGGEAREGKEGRRKKERMGGIKKESSVLAEVATNTGQW